ncbi:MAG: hypothetical protein NWE88_01940 [Candidatus Bathyarchaeota archaeon]|nr:hypothetical protein [Candidatus Bathyarchaeota archaeon]
MTQLQVLHIVGAIDLVTILELVFFGFFLGTVTANYFEGFFGLNKFEEMGEGHRKELLAFFRALASDTSIIIRSFNKSKLDFRANNKAVSLTIHFKNIPCYIVLNHANCTSQILSKLPRDLIKLVRYLGENQIPEDIISMQLYFDTVLMRWKYLFIPSRESYGNYIDRYIDLIDGKIYPVFSEDDFLTRFNPPTEDSLKFIITHFDKR